MEMTLYSILGFLMAYLIGSIPTAVWYGKMTMGIDIRDYGSGNAGATNSFRVMGKKAGTVVMLIDVLKGFIATEAAFWLMLGGLVPGDHLVLTKSAFGIAAVIGHIFPIYARFKGGKGIATLLGMMLSVHVEATLMCVLVFVIVLLISKYVSLGSMLAALTFPLVCLMPQFQPYQAATFLIVFGFAIFVMVVFTHQKNIVRLINGEESKANISIRKKRE